MRTVTSLICALAFLAGAGTLFAQDITGDWQGTNANERGREGCTQAFQKVMPTARVVRLPGATHFVFVSNEGDVLREVRDFARGHAEITHRTTQIRLGSFRP